MRTKIFAASMTCLAVLAVGFPLWAGQVRDGLTLPQEIGLNERQPPEFVLKVIGIRPGMAVGEVGAGRGRYSVQIASRIGPGGRLYANDIDRDSLSFLRLRVADLGLTNVEIVTGTVTETNLPPKTMDLVVMVNVVHCLADPVTLLKNVGASLKPDGQMAVVEGNLDKDPSAAGEWFSRAKLMGIFQAAGYSLVREDASLPKDNIYLLKKRTP